MIRLEKASFEIQCILFQSKDSLRAQFSSTVLNQAALLLEKASHTRITFRHFPK